MKHSKIGTLVATLRTELDVMTVVRDAVQAAPDVPAVETIERNMGIVSAMLERLGSDDAEAPKPRAPRKAKKPTQD